MKSIIVTLIILSSFIYVKAQNTLLPEFNDKPAYYNVKDKKLVELEKSQYNTLAKAKGLFKAEAGFFINESSSPVKISKQTELKFIIKVTPGTDPTSVVDFVKFEVRDNKRVFITTKAKVTSTSTSFEKIMYVVEKIKEGNYFLIVKNLDKGEYFFGSSEFMFAFSVE